MTDVHRSRDRRPPVTWQLGKSHVNFGRQSRDTGTVLRTVVTARNVIYNNSIYVDLQQ